MKRDSAWPALSKESSKQWEEKVLKSPRWEKIRHKEANVTHRAREKIERNGLGETKASLSTHSEEFKSFSKGMNLLFFGLGSSTLISVNFQ